MNSKSHTVDWRAGIRWNKQHSEVAGAALVLGPFLGGILLENFGGRSPFAFAAVLGFIALLAMVGFVPAPWPDRIWDSDSDDHLAIQHSYGTQLLKLLLEHLSKELDHVPHRKTEPIS